MQDDLIGGGDTSDGLDNPDDEEEGFELVLDFETPVQEFGFSIADLNTGEAGSVTFKDSAASSNNSQTIAFTEFEDSASPYFRSGVDFGNHHANQIAPIDADDLIVDQFDVVTFNFSSSGATGEINFTSVPEPASMTAVFGLIAFVCARRWR
ncbi:MAG: hypothetical protein ACFB21_15350 [Opitutales bacterium]